MTSESPTSGTVDIGGDGVALVAAAVACGCASHGAGSGRVIACCGGLALVASGAPPPDAPTVIDCAACAAATASAEGRCDITTVLGALTVPLAAMSASAACEGEPSGDGPLVGDCEARLVGLERSTSGDHACPATLWDAATAVVGVAAAALAGASAVLVLAARVRDGSANRPKPYDDAPCVAAKPTTDAGARTRDHLVLDPGDSALDDVGASTDACGDVAVPR